MPKLLGISKHPDKVQWAVETAVITPISSLIREIQQRWLAGLGVGVDYIALNEIYGGTSKELAVKSMVDVDTDLPFVTSNNLLFDVVAGWVEEHHGDMVIKSSPGDDINNWFIRLGSGEDTPDWVYDPVKREQAITKLTSLIEELLPRYVINDKIKLGIVRAHYAGQARSRLIRLSAGEISSSINKLPTEPPDNRYVRNIIDYSRRNSASLVTNATRELLSGIRATMERAATNRYTAKEVEAELYSKFGMFNRDWRRIAVTEASIASSNGMLLSLPEGSVVKSIEAYHGACEWCRENSAGKLFKVVSPESVNKDPVTQVWVGKNNYGVPRSEWTVSAGANHPHCRKVWGVARRPRNAD